MADEGKKTPEQIREEMRIARSDQPLISSEEFAMQVESMIGSTGMKKSHLKSKCSNAGPKSVALSSAT